MRFHTTVLTGMVLLAGACAGSRIDTVARLGANPGLGGGTYTTGGGLTVAADLRNVNGLTLVCGVWAIGQQSALTKLAEQQVLNSGAVYRGKERIVSGLLFMRRVEPTPSYGGKEANCHLTVRPWRTSANKQQAEIFLPPQVVANESENLFGNHLIWFRPTGPGAGSG